MSQTPDQHAGRNWCDMEKEVYIRRELHAFFACVSVRVHVSEGKRGILSVYRMRFEDAEYRRSRISMLPDDMISLVD